VRGFGVLGFWGFGDLEHEALVVRQGLVPTRSGYEYSVLMAAIQRDDWEAMHKLVREATPIQLGLQVPSGQTMAGSTVFHLAAFKSSKGMPWWGPELLRDMAWKASG
jgi:hypothetical protein